MKSDKTTVRSEATAEAGADITKATLETLAYYEYNISGEVFIKNFITCGGTDHMARHLWDKFHQYHHKILTLWGSLDNENRELMPKVIAMGYK